MITLDRGEPEPAFPSPGEEPHGAAIVGRSGVLVPDRVGEEGAEAFRGFVTLLGDDGRDDRGAVCGDAVPRG
jgi:hypothetical protein